MKDDLRYIAIEGPIGVGKTSLARALAARLGARLVLEEAAENPFLEKFYSDMPQYALATQLAFLLSRCRQQVELGQPDLFAPLAVSDYILAKDRIFAGLTLSDPELGLYNQLHAVLATRIAKPDVVVVLRARPDTLLERVRVRAVPYESAITREYLERLVAAYDLFFRTYDETPVLPIDTDCVDLSRGGASLDRLVRDIRRSAAARGRSEE